MKKLFLPILIIIKLLSVFPLSHGSAKLELSVYCPILYSYSLINFRNAWELNHSGYPIKSEFSQQSSAHQDTVLIEGYTQGTYYRILYYTLSTVFTKQEIEIFLKNFLQTASLWEENSLIAKVNRNEHPVLNEDFITIFNKAQEISEMTNGAFDITVGDLVNIWGFGISNRQEPTQIMIDSLLQYTGYRNIAIRNNRMIKKFPEIKIDFNAIAKGYSVDLMSRKLQDNGIDNFIVDIGGEIRTSGTKPDGSPWYVGIEKPSKDNSSDRTVQSIILLKDKSVATSGTYRKYYEENGVRYSHTIDPRTGYPVSHRLLSATVIADDCITADALATAFMVMGEKESMDFLKKYPQFEGYFIFIDDNDNLRISYTDGFKKLIVKE